MGQLNDQRLPSERAEEEAPPPPYKPPLPPRDTESYQAPPPSDSREHTFIPRLYARPTTLTWAEQDPRNVSTESLVPEYPTEHKRILLLIYIHGFVGNETSFQSFPAHVHNVATPLVSKTHDVHTKIYPRYKSRRAVNFARDDFSKWLAPHESPDTEVILLGHSMGGIVSAEVALMPPFSSHNSSPFFHRILGTINFDTPFLGMHPGVVASGLGSIFKPAASPPPKNRQSLDTTSPLNSPGTPSTSAFEPTATPLRDPNYDPPFTNDVRIPTRKGWENAMHFFNKHSDDLVHAAKTYVTSHLEFGGAMADYKSLNTRYKKIRGLEDIDDSRISSRPGQPTRVRFVNYYTASTGRPKRKSPSPDRGRHLGGQGELGRSMQELSVTSSKDTFPPAPTRSPPKSPRLSIQSPQGTVNVVDPASDIPATPENIEPNRSSESERMQHLDPEPYEHKSDDDLYIAPTDDPSQTKHDGPTADTIDEYNTKPNSHSIEFPPLPPDPEKPEDFDPTSFTNPDMRKLAEKDYKRRIKAYDAAVKDRRKAISERTKMIEKREKAIQKEQEKALKAERKSQAQSEKERLKGEEARMKAEEARMKGEEARLKGLQSPTASLTPQTTNDGSIPPSLAPSSSTDRRSSESGDEIQTSDLVTGEATRSGDGKQKKKRDKKFCMLPKKGPSGARDPAWIRVFMEGVDEVGAHCGLFFPENPHYGNLVNDVGEKILEWVERDEEVRRGRTR